MTSQLIFNDGAIKSRLREIGKGWFVAEWKSATDPEAQWFPWIAGTSEWLCLTDQEKAWAK